MNAIRPLAPDPDEIAEALKALRAQYLAQISVHIATVQRFGEHAPGVCDWLLEAQHTVHDFLDPVIATAVLAADEAAVEAEGVDEAAHIAAERSALVAGAGLQWGRR